MMIDLVFCHTDQIYLLLQLDQLPPAGSSSSAAWTGFCSSKTMTGPQHCKLQNTEDQKKITI